MNDAFQALVDAHPEWSKAVRASVAALGESAPSPPSTVTRLHSVGEPVSERPATAETHAAPPAAVRADSPAVEPWVKKRDIAEALRVSERTVERYQRDGMPYGGARVGAVRFRISECEAWASAHRTPRARADAAAHASAPQGHAPQGTAPAGNRPSRPQDGASQGFGRAEPLSAPVAPVSARSTPPVEPWVDVAAVAAHLACNPEHVYELAKRTDARRIPHRRDGRRLLFKLGRVDSWLDRSGAE
jgi:hypothetical protein